MKIKKNRVINYICPVCGYSKLDEPPYDQQGYPSYDICSCCGFEFGVTDGDKGYSFASYRNEWIEGGYKFWNSDEPKDWNEENAKRQLENLKS